MPNRPNNSTHSSKNFKQSFFNKVYCLIKSLFVQKNLDSNDSRFVEQVNDIEHQAQSMSESEKHLLSNMLQFYNKTVEDVMVPRSDICAISTKSTLQELNDIILKNAHTRTLVYDDTLDNIVGFVHIKDLFVVMVNKTSFNLTKIMRKPIIAAASMRLIDLLAEMQRRRTHIAVVVDEYGGTDGIATIEDIMEAIVDKIEDEHDDVEDENNSYVINDSGEVIASARVEIEVLEKVLSVQLKNASDDCDTIGGLILLRVGNVPSRGVIVNLTDRVKAEVIESTPRVLKKVKLVYNTK